MPQLMGEQHHLCSSNTSDASRSGDMISRTTGRRAGGVQQRLAMGGVILTGAVLFLLVSSAYGGGTPEVNVAFNNSVVAAELAVAQPVTPCSTCFENSTAAETHEHETLAPTKGAETAGDPLVRTNHIGLTRYAADTAAEEVPDQLHTSHQGGSDPNPTLTTLQDRLRSLSEAANREYESRLRDFSSSINVQPSASSVLYQDTAETKETHASPAGHTPELPNLFSHEEGFISTMTYGNNNGDPSKYIRSSTILEEDDMTTGFTSTRSFSYDEPISIAPTSVNVILSTSGEFDVHLSGSSSLDHTEEPQNSSNTTDDAASSATTPDLHNSTETTTHSFRPRITITIKGKLTTLSEDDDLFGMNNKTDITSKLTSTVDTRLENESTNKNVTTERTSESTTSKPIEDLDVSMAEQIMTVTSSSTTSRTRSSENTSPRSSWRGTTRYVTPENVFLASAESTTVSSIEVENSTASIPQITTVEVTTARSENSTSPMVTTRRLPPVSAEDPTTQRVTQSPQPAVTTYRGTVAPTSSTTAAAPPRDTQGEESSVECSTMEDTSTVTEEQTSRPEENTTASTEEAEQEATTNIEVSTTPLSEEATVQDYTELQTEASSRRTISTAPTQRTSTPKETDAPPTDYTPHAEKFLHVTVATTWEELCRSKDSFRQGIADLLARGTNRDVTVEHVVILNDDECLQPPPSTPAGIGLHVYFADKHGKYDAMLTEAFPRLWAADVTNKLQRSDQITCVDLRKMSDEATSPATAVQGNIIAVVAIAGVAVSCLFLLLILMLVMRKRQKRYNYGQRCTPVSLDAYSLDSVSVYNSVRRKGHLRASKRSYGNPAFDDPDSPSHPVNFAGLANCSGETAALHEEFALVPLVTARMEELPQGAESKNRYANVIPLPETRVPLSRRGSDPLSEYINANFVRGPKNAPKYYIACQAPLESTVCDFWRMIWEHQCKVVLMLTDLEENGVEKCADYLPPSEVLDCHRRFGDYHVTLKKREVRDNYAVSTLQLKNMDSNLWREVTHLWFFGWPASGVPEEPSSLIAYLLEARAFMKSNSGPTVVHCSPGTGRAGTVLACDLCIREFEQSRLVDVPRVVHRLRRDRAGAVQTREQYVFIYQVLNVYAAKLTGGAMDSF
ncbi:hypothetical protein B566_EDAN012316 [Ephemera danica]|nr:hypothetical protein B566_EDAN012316 [Ephemera danica]